MTQSVVPTPDKEREPSVENGVILRSSVSAIKLFDPHSDGGCGRKWAYSYVFGIKETKTDALKTGGEAAIALENYLTTGVDAMPDFLRAIKHLIPHPRLVDGRTDLQVEWPLSLDPNDPAMHALTQDARKKLGQERLNKAIALRRAFLKPENAPGRPVLLDTMRRHAGLLAGNVPLAGAADWRHRRQEYHRDGVWVKEDPGMVVLAIGDLKTVKQIDDHVTKPRGKHPGGKHIKGWAKTDAQVLDDTQVLGYGVQAAYRYPDTSHLRLELHYSQKKGAFAGAIRGGLISVEDVLRKWSRIDRLMSEMEDVARVKTPDEAPPNFYACNSYGHIGPDGEYHQGCGYQYVCDRSAMRIYHVLDLKEPNMDPNYIGVFAQVPVMPPANGTSGGHLLASLTKPEIVVPAPAEHATAPAFTGQALAECPKCRASGKVVQYIPTLEQCPSCNAPTVLVPHIGAVNPPDGPKVVSLLDSAAPLPADVIAKIEDPEIHKVAQTHAAAHAERTALQEAREQASGGKTSGRCPGGKQRVKLTQQQAGSRKYVCPSCGVELKIKPSADFSEATLPGHNKPKDEAQTSMPETATPAIEDMTLPPLPADDDMPPLPDDDMPPLPTDDYVAPGALPGQTAMPGVVSPAAPVLAFGAKDEVAEARADLVMAIADAEKALARLRSLL